MKSKINVIITAGGQSQRYGTKNKLFEECGASCVLIEAIKPFLHIDGITRVIIGIETSYADELARELEKLRKRGLLKAERSAESDYFGKAEQDDLSELSGEDDDV